MKKQLTRSGWRDLNDRIESLLVRMCMHNGIELFSSSEYISFNMHPTNGRVFALSKNPSGKFLDIDIFLKTLKDEGLTKINARICNRYKGNETTIESLRFEDCEESFELVESEINSEHKLQKTPYRHIQKVHTFSNGYVLNPHTNFSEIYNKYLSGQITPVEYQASIYLQKLITNHENWNDLQNLTENIFKKLF